MTERLVVVSNRVGPVKDAARAGGLAVALLEALRAGGGLWFGWSSRVEDNPGALPDIEEHGRLSTATLHLSPEDHGEYYNGFANRTLWPLFHYRIDLATFDRENYQSYLRVNQRFARALHPLLSDRDRIWVHDYHFLAFGEELRRMGSDHPIGFFLHIPFPAPEVLTTLPVADMLVRAMFAYDVIGFQTDVDRRCFIDYVVEEANGKELPDGRLRAYGRTVEVATFPIGIDADTFARFAVSRDAQVHIRRMRGMLREREAVIGVDRLDYTKGIPERFRAFERLIRAYPEHRGRVSLLQIAPPSRADVPEYQQIRRTLESMSGSINAEHSEFDWTPIRYINRGFSRRALAGIFRVCRVGLVTPLRDGMNLVAKEYVAAQDPENPGVLVLSRFAGAARRLSGALIVNPYDVQGVADALQSALNMPLEERRARWEGLVQAVRGEDIGAWRDGFLSRLRAVMVPREES